ncbi:MAG TPA: NAD(+) synthase, partial [Cytophagales bacterium]|nr:NAD(+) synthase [Cytophagales bacterium]
LVRKMVDFGLEEIDAENLLYKLGLKINKTDHALSNNEYITSQLLHCAYQATENSSQNTFLSAMELAKEIGATFYNWQIDDVLKLYTKKMEEATNYSLTWEKDDLVLQNIQARVRAPFIWMLANMKNGLLLSTSNRSEGDVGYCTMDGDTAGGLAPIAGVDKTFIQHWLKWAEKKFKFNSLKHVNNLIPTAELRPLETKQTDESDLMPYALLLQIEKLAIHEKLSTKQVFETIKKRNEYDEEILKTSVQKFYRLWQRNQWKRDRLAPSFHLDDFNVDPKTWCRYPILSGDFEEELKYL